MFMRMCECQINYIMVGIFVQNYEVSCQCQPVLSCLFDDTSERLKYYSIIKKYINNDISDDFRDMNSNAQCFLRDFIAKETWTHWLGGYSLYQFSFYQKDNIIYENTMLFIMLSLIRTIMHTALTSASVHFLQLRASV